MFSYSENNPHFYRSVIYISALNAKKKPKICIPSSSITFRFSHTSLSFYLLLIHIKLSFSFLSFDLIPEKKGMFKLAEEVETIAVTPYYTYLP